MLKILSLHIALISSFAALAQFTDDFSDGEFVSAPSWSGDTDKFVIVGNQLRSNHSPTSNETYYLSTASTVIYDASWEFYIELDLSTSGLNYVDMFLVADMTDLANAQNGYFVRVGDTADEIVLYKLSNGERSVLIDDDVRRVDGSTNNQFRIMVSRDAIDLFTLEVDDGNTGTYETIGTATDSEITASSAFGVRIKQSTAASAINSHFFDDFQLTGASYPDTQAPTLSNYEILSGRQISLIFSEEVDKETAESISNYSLSPGIVISSAEKQLDQINQVILNLELPLINGTEYMIALTNVEDLSGNAISPTERTFDYVIFSIPFAGEVLINEFQVAPNDSEFVELYNYSDKYFNLENWKIEDEVGNQLILPTFRLDPYHYVVVTSAGGTDSLDVSGFPLFNNSSDAVILKYTEGSIVHAVSYDDFEEGRSLELISPANICKGFVNYAINSDGNSAGLENDNFSNLLDQKGPTVVVLQVESADSVIVTFDEPIGTVSTLEDSLIVNNQLAKEASFSEDRTTVRIKLAVPLVNEVIGNLSIKNLPDCLGNMSGSIDTTLYIDKKSPEVVSLVLLSATELIIDFQEALEAVTPGDLSKFNLSDGLISKVDEIDTARSSLLIDISLPLSKSKQYQLFIDGLEDTLGNALVDTLLFTFESAVEAYEVISSNTVAIQFDVDLDTENIKPESFWIDDLGNARSVEFIQPSLVQISFAEPFEDNEYFRLYCLNLYDISGQRLITPALEVLFDTNPPQLAHWQVPHPDSIFLIFDEPIDLTSAVNFSHYRINERVPQNLFLINDSSLYLQPPFSLESEVFYELELQGQVDLAGNQVNNRQTYDIMYDTQAPRVESILQVAMSQLQVLVNEPLDTSKTIRVGWLTDNERQTGDVVFAGPKRLLIKMEDSIPQTEQLTFYLLGWTDLLGNTTLDTIKVEINTKRPSVVQITPVSQSRVSLEYNQRMSTSALDMENYQLENRSIESISEVDGRYLLHVPRISIEDSTCLDIAHVANASGSNMYDTTVFFQYDNFLKEIRVLEANQVVIDFVEELDVNSPLNVSIGDLSIRYQGLDLTNTTSYEVTLGESLPENQQVSIRWDSAKTVLGVVVPGYSSLLTYDTQVPSIDRVESDFFNQIRVYFSEAIEASVGLEPFNYQIENLETPLNVTELSESCFALTLDTLEVGKNYTLTVENLLDINGNINPSDTVNFVYSPPAIPGFHELRITEIMSDPSPVVGLPDIEYIEIWNGTGTPYSLEGVFISDESRKYALPDTLIAPHTYMALAGEKDSLFTYIKGFPTLNNSGERIALLTVFGDLIDSVSYASQWISSPEKRDGGYSLELVNLESSCEGPANWEASVAANGGTPGSINSIASQSPDTLAPSVETFMFLDSLTVALSFSEYMDTSLVPALESGRWNAVYQDLQHATVALDTPLSAGKIHRFQLSGFMDCSGNTLLDTTLVLAVPREAHFGDLMISEIMPDPTPQVGLEEDEYVELINLTDEVINLGGLTINEVALQGVLMPETYLVLVPSSLSTTDSYFNKQVVSPWIGLTNARDTIRLTSQHEVLVELIYEDTWYKSVEKNSGGYSLEIIDPFLVCGRAENWAASVAPSGGTPGAINSNYQLIGDETSPGIIDISFDREELVVTLSESKLHTEISWGFQPSLIASLQDPLTEFPHQLIFDFEGEPRRNEPYSVSLSELSDCYGNIADSLGASFLIPEPTIDDIYINEVLFDPLAGGDDFVELFNASDHEYLDLSTLSWRTNQNNIQLTDEFVLNPQSYVALTENKPQLLFDYPQADPLRIIEVENLPTLPNVEGTLTLVDFRGIVLDSIYYSSSFHSSLLSDEEGVSLERLSISFSAVAANAWSSAASIAGFATPGSKNSQSVQLPNHSEKLTVEPRTFVPGSSNPTFSALTTISIKNEINDRLANVWIVNSAGKIVKTLAQGILLGSEGFLTWDGTSDTGALVEMGQYLVVIEFYGGDTTAEVIKQPVTVGSDF